MAPAWEGRSDLRDERVALASGHRGLECPRRHWEVPRLRAARDVRAVVAIEGDGVCRVVRLTTEKRREHQCRSERIELRHERVAREVAAELWLERRAQREIGRIGHSNDDRVSTGIQGDCLCVFGPGAAQVARVQQLAAIGGELRDERIVLTAKCRLERCDRREVGRGGIPRDEHVACGCGGEPEGGVVDAATKVGGVHERGTGRGQLCHDVSLVVAPLT